MGDSINSHQLSNVQFEKIASIIYKNCGIHLTPSKKIMVESRLNRRLRQLSISSFEKYMQLITSQEGIKNELVFMIDVITTNKTDFFRESHHFDFLTESLLPQLLDRNENKTLRVWSAACSTGEEPYTIAMVLEEFAQLYPKHKHEILASDISTDVLKKASAAIYPADRINDIPQKFRQRYLLRSKNNSNPRIRIVPKLREKVEFRRINLVEPDLRLDQQQDVIFCRNVLIYFDRDTQLKVITNLLKNLRKDGFLLIGHSESLLFFDLPIRQVRPTIFIKN
jgi:chemotaxis protein methyltransferase CheR